MYAGAVPFLKVKTTHLLLENLLGMCMGQPSLELCVWFT